MIQKEVGGRLVALELINPFPTWGIQMPPPMKSFLRQYDLSGKTIIPFNTNAGYGVGTGFQTVKDLCPKSKILEGISKKIWPKCLSARDEIASGPWRAPRPSGGGLQHMQCRSLRSLPLLFSALLLGQARQRSENNNAPSKTGHCICCARDEIRTHTPRGATTSK
ncbi:flavodoxin family protein [Puia dinghuensis]|uniref:flavodoxin family protein n=1 Tax=Puia dinghuensis TaxID=1792502 RepID=UPI00166B008B|nr:flavodoxin [Puia dinghuensis]